LIAGKRVLVLTGPLLGLAALGWLLSLALWRVQFRSPVVSARMTSRRAQATSRAKGARVKGARRGRGSGGTSVGTIVASDADHATETSVPVSAATPAPPPSKPTKPAAPAAAVRELSKEEVAEVTPAPPPPPPTSLDQLLAKTREDRAKRTR
jgi:hypothetical protein